MAGRRAQAGARATCQHCDNPLVAVLPVDGYFRTIQWNHVDPEVAEIPNRCGHGSHAKPKEWCSQRQNDGTPCWRVVKTENLTAGHYGCGIHIRDAIREAEWKAQSARREAEREEREALGAWEDEQYRAAYDRIQEWLPSMEHRLTGYVGMGRIERTISVDVIEMKRALEELLDNRAD